MKRIYVSPEIVYEDFSLSTNIAAGCDFKTSLPSEGACPYFIGATGDTVFVNDSTGCGGNSHQAPNGEYGNICYHVPNTESNVFAS